MKFIIILLACACALVAAAPAEEIREYDISNAPELFEGFVQKYERKYKNEQDRLVHYEAFVENLKNINRLNKSNPQALFGINQFADYTEEDRKRMRGFVIPGQE